MSSLLGHLALQNLMCNYLLVKNWEQIAASVHDLLTNTWAC